LQSRLPPIGHIPDQQARETDNEFTQLIVLSPQSIEIRLERMRVVLGNAAVVVRALDDALRHGGPSYSSANWKPKWCATKEKNRIANDEH
jgi:hypothetical protein